jgi:hypothetical protein
MPGSSAVVSRAARSLAEGRKAVASRAPEPDLIGIYLNDHLAGATLGTELAWRSAAAVVGTAAAGDLRCACAATRRTRPGSARKPAA